METILQKLYEPCPQWLLDYQPGQHLDMQQVLCERILYYPGAGYDGQPIETFNAAHAVHVFLYVDYLVTREELEKRLSCDGFKGYHLLGTVEITETDLVPQGWQPHVMTAGDTRFEHAAPYCFMNLYERDAGYDEAHGSQRFAVIFLYADAHATYDAIFANPPHMGAPFVVVLQDHGFGGNYSSFGDGGLLHKIATRSQVFPDYLLVATNTRCWDHYQQVSSSAVYGGEHNHKRHLYQREMIE